LLTGELPAEHYAPPSAQSDVDPRVDAIVQQALEKERDRRQGSVGEVKTQVENITRRAASSEARAKPASVRGLIVVHALLALACLWLFGSVVPRMLAMLNDMLGDPSNWPGLTRALAAVSRHFLLSSLLIVAAFSADVGVCFLLSRKTALGLRIWNRAVILFALFAFVLVMIGVFSPLRPAITLLGLGAAPVGSETAPMPVEDRKAGATAAQSPSAVESWSYTPRYLTEAKFAEWEKAGRGDRSERSREISFKHEAGVITVTGPRERVRFVATLLRVIDQPEVKDPLELPILNMPPEFFLRIAWPALMAQNDFAKGPFTDALRESWKSEGINAPQLARALSAHVLELEKAAFVNHGAPFETIARSPGASISYDVTIPCADQPDKPLTLRIQRTTQQIGTQSHFASFAPWLIEEAKKQSKDPLDVATEREPKK
jgi:hypothetical protein